MPKSRRTIVGSAMIFALGGVLGSAVTVALVDSGPAVATTTADGPDAPATDGSIAGSLEDDLSRYPGDEWDDPGYGDGYGSGRE
jgi:hypothetical protein